MDPSHPHDFKSRKTVETNGLEKLLSKPKYLKLALANSSAQPLSATGSAAQCHAYRRAQTIPALHTTCTSLFSRLVHCLGWEGIPPTKGTLAGHAG